MITKNYLPKESLDSLNSALVECKGKFKNSMGVRSKQGLNGLSSVFETHKYFDMSPDLRELTKSCLSEQAFLEAIEVYFLRFPEGGFLDDYKAVPNCFLECKSVLLTDTATVVVAGTTYNLVKGDTITIPLKEVHSVESASELTDFLVLLKIKQ
jgi:hypothetical protein